jgi:SET domain-containing protein
MLESDNVKVSKSKVSGWGVFAKKKFAPGDLIDVSICLVKHNEEWSTATEDYIFSRGNYSAFPLGNGGVFNHSNSPNARHELTARLKELHVFAVKNIEPDEEIFISYGQDYFVTRNFKAK